MLRFHHAIYIGGSLYDAMRNWVYTYGFDWELRPTIAQRRGDVHIRYQVAARRERAAPKTIQMGTTPSSSTILRAWFPPGRATAIGSIW
jgi:hypothetical protein